MPQEAALPVKMEISSGGVVTEGRKLLLVRVRNIKGDLLWTFPKGHLEEGESEKEAALREVEEETGYRCRVLRPLKDAEYSFKREGVLIRKKVHWFWMHPVGRFGKPDAVEISDVRWVAAAKCRKMICYPSDLQLLEMTEKLMAGEEA